MATSQGYKCEFLDSVPEDFYCKKCTLVARRLVYTSCCEDIFCHDCVADIKHKDRPCPACGEESFTIMELKRSQKKVMQLNVYCSMKERGCVWAGTLEQLNTHLDPHLDNCQYVDTQCPLNCLQIIPKNKMELHVTQECTKRPHVCQHCSFKATYEEVIDTHLPKCKYVPLQCPNMCGVTCEREVMEDHLKICRLEEVECEFSSVGCDGRFIREDQDEHDRQNSQKHLTLTASLTVQTQQQLQMELEEQDKKHKDEEEKLKMKIEEQEKKIEEQENTIKEQKKKIGGQEKRFREQGKEQEEQAKTQEKKLVELQENLEELQKNLREQEKRLGEQEKKLGEQEKKLGEQEKKLGEQEKKLGEQEKKLGEQEKKLGEQEKKLGEQEKKLGEQKKKIEEQGTKFTQEEKLLTEQKKTITELKAQATITECHNLKLSKLELELQESKMKLSHCATFIHVHQKFVMHNFSNEKSKDVYNDWKSPAMYTHLFGYKFCIGVDANGYKEGRGKTVYVDVWSLPGEFDDKLKWPAEAQITIELVNRRGGNNAKLTQTFTLKKELAILTNLKRIPTGFIEHSKLSPYLVSDKLIFHISDIRVW